MIIELNSRMRVGFWILASISRGKDNKARSPNAPSATPAAPMPCSWPRTCPPAPPFGPVHGADVCRHARPLLDAAVPCPRLSARPRRSSCAER